MKLDVTKKWCLEMARREGNAEVAAGLLAFDPEPKEPAEGTDEVHRHDDPHLAFGPLIALLRRRHGLTIEKLAVNADVEPGDLVSIERDPHYTPEPRTVFQLARVFRLPNKRLMQLSGLAVAKDARFRQAAVRFAALSVSIEALSKEEKTVLESFIKFLSEEEDKGR